MSKAKCDTKYETVGTGGKCYTKDLPPQGVDVSTRKNCKAVSGRWIPDDATWPYYHNTVTDCYESRGPHPNVQTNSCPLNNHRFTRWSSNIENNQYAQCGNPIGSLMAENVLCCKCKNEQQLYPNESETHDDKTCTSAGLTTLCCWNFKLPYMSIIPFRYKEDQMNKLDAWWTKLCEPSALAGHPITIIDVPSDGNCGFHAIAMACNSGLVDCNNPKNGINNKTLHSVTSLRSVVANYIDDTNYNDYLELIKQDMSDNSYELYEGIDDAEKLKLVILDSQHYATTVDLRWLSTYLGVNIVTGVLNKDVGTIPSLTLTHTPEWWDARPSIFLILHGKGKHYTLVASPRYAQVYQAMFWPDDVPGAPKYTANWDMYKNVLLDYPPSISNTETKIFTDHHAI